MKRLTALHLSFLSVLFLAWSRTSLPADAKEILFKTEAAPPIAMKIQRWNCCETYFSSVNMAATLTYSKELAPKETAFLHYGISEPGKPWTQKGITELVLKDGIRQIKTKTISVGRGGFGDARFQFAIEIRSTGGKSRWDKGSESTYGSYQASIFDGNTVFSAVERW